MDNNYTLIENNNCEKYVYVIILTTIASSVFQNNVFIQKMIFASKPDGVEFTND